jgi:5-methyltetrahydropteroyltriglutamate--homocysteine methyltransferase
MNLILTHAGSYPRIGDSPDLQILRQTLALFDRGEATDADIRRAEDEMVRRAIAEQIEAGLDLVTDGQIRWYDPISHVAGKLRGTKINGLLRYFDTNFYFRQPVLVDRLERERPILREEYLYARSVSARPVKPVLTGPYTLAVFSLVERQEYRDLGRRVEDYAAVLAEEIADLAAAGAELIQVDEPAIVLEDAVFDLFAAGVQRLAHAKGAARLALYVSFGDVTPLYARLQELPVDVVGVDFTYSPHLVERIAVEGSAKALGLGLIDGRNTKLEPEAEVAAALERLLPAIRSDVAYLNPSTGLEFLPRDRAFRKLRHLVAIGMRFKS